MERRTKLLSYIEKGVEKMGGNPLEGGEPWFKFEPPYCVWVLIHNLPTPIAVVLKKGEAEIRIDGMQYPMYPEIEVRCQGTVEIHNTQRVPREPEEKTEIWYRHLE